MAEAGDWGGPRLQPPAPQANVPRSEVGKVVDAILLDKQVRWIAIIQEGEGAAGDTFTVHPYITDPTS